MLMFDFSWVCVCMCVSSWALKGVTNLTDKYCWMDRKLRQVHFSFFVPGIVQGQHATCARDSCPSDLPRLFLTFIRAAKHRLESGVCGIQGGVWVRAAQTACTCAPEHPCTPPPASHVPDAHMTVTAALSSAAAQVSTSPRPEKSQRIN